MSSLSLSARINDEGLVEIYDCRNSKTLGTITQKEAEFLEGEYKYENGKEIFDLTMLLVSLGVSFQEAYLSVYKEFQKPENIRGF